MHTVHYSHPGGVGCVGQQWPERVRMKFQGVGTWRNSDEGAEGRERAIEGVRGVWASPAAAHRELSIAGVPTQLHTLFILNMNINEGLLKYGYSSLPYPTATRPWCQPTTAARARPCSSTELACLECKKISLLPSTQLSHNPTSVLCVFVCMRVCAYRKSGISALFPVLVT